MPGTVGGAAGWRGPRGYRRSRRNSGCVAMKSSGSTVGRLREQGFIWPVYECRNSHAMACLDTPVGRTSARDAADRDKDGGRPVVPSHSGASDVCGLPTTLPYAAANRLGDAQAEPHGCGDDEESDEDFDP